MSTDISERIRNPEELYRILCEKVFWGQENPLKQGQGQEQGALFWRERSQVPTAIAIGQSLQWSNTVLLILPTEHEAYKIHGDLQAMGLPAMVFPEWGTSLYKGIRSQTRIFTERSSVLAQMICGQGLQEKRSQEQATQQKASQQKNKIIVLTSLRAMDRVLPPQQEFRKYIQPLRIGAAFQPAELASLLSSYGYYQVPRVSLPGEFALRGEVLDFYPPEWGDIAGSLWADGSSGADTSGANTGKANKTQGDKAKSASKVSRSTTFKGLPAGLNAGLHAKAVRVMFGFDEIEMLKIFDTSSQISHRAIEEFPLFPLKEVLWQPESLQNLRVQLEDQLLQNTEASQQAQEQDIEQELQELDELLDKLALQQEVYAEELLFPLAWQKPVTLCDYLSSEALVLFWGQRQLEQQQETYALELESLYQKQQEEVQESRRGNGQEKKQAAKQKNKKNAELLLPSPQRAIDLAELRAKSPFSITVDAFEGEPWPLKAEAGLQYFGNVKQLGKDLQQWIQEGYFIGLGATSTAQAQRIAHLLQDFAEDLHFFNCELSQGVVFPEQKLILLQEWQVLGKDPESQRDKKKQKHIEKRLTQSEIISSFVELKEGDFVVHVQHGVGRFKGIERVSTTRMERDYITLEYADDSILFVPIEQINMVQRYIGSGSDSGIRLDRIGGKAWQERKAKTQKSVEDLADKLLRLYVRRVEVEGYSYPDDDELQEEFEADFPYEPTKDQLRSIFEIKQDLESPKPMDRLLCGDVGFGKTEVAMRACFKVVNSGGRQVMLLCPTTILAEQHYQNFCQRFARFPIRIAMLSRFVDNPAVVLKDLEQGKVDILIGTHRILSKDIHLNNLGLIVIDEEQRFGVKHKERLKMLKTSVDCLSMSATPIPRTLHMSLVQIRDISMITTAPSNRHPVETFVREFNSQSIVAAIRHELSRGGQVFYLHNRVEGLEEVMTFLRELVPEALVEMAHGQMPSAMLEDIMYRFVHGGFNVLLSTTIIENGIDIPNVNTIIIDRADRYGISQLYQLRGRVGRSDQLAYAYLFYPGRSGLSDIALKRLKIISDFTELGSGFKVAMKDLEVRGAGNLLGPEQSGNILSVGFEMYTGMLAKAMNERKARVGAEIEEYREEISLELNYSGFIPDSYIPDATEKIDLYKRISQIDRAELLAEFYEELYDRFGNPPDEVNSLLSLAEVRILCREIGITYLKERPKNVELHFSKLKPPPLEKIVQQIQQNPNLFRLESKEQNDVLLIDLVAFIAQEAREAQAAQTQAAQAAQNKQAEQKKKSGKKHAAKTQELQHTEAEQDPSLLCKAGALRKLLSGFQN